jgi:hypothetical protein
MINTTVAHQRERSSGGKRYPIASSLLWGGAMKMTRKNSGFPNNKMGQICDK